MDSRWYLRQRRNGVLLPIGRTVHSSPDPDCHNSGGASLNRRPRHDFGFTQIGGTISIANHIGDDLPNNLGGSLHYSFYGYESKKNLSFS